MIHRRELLLVGAGVLAAKATASAVACAQDPETGPDKGKDKPADKGKDKPKTDDPKADPHAGHAGHEGGGAAAGSKHATFVSTLADCVAAGEVCMTHCISLLSQGDKSMGECAASVHQMLAMCKAMGTLAAADSSHLKAAAAVCKDLCSECEAACKPHVEHHAQCKACAEACRATVAEIDKLG